ncbi:MAG: hypothetical protein J6A94_07635 [Lachnospiraceae bacterium]|nr:hypothetical protein [Lachnospiraceae bacterium]
MNHKNGKIAQQIIELQKDDGTWGNVFHSLSVPTNRQPMTTEQALRRLKNLGFTIEDAPIRKAVDCMEACLRGERKIDNYWEKTLDWDLYTKLMLSTWIKIFEPKNPIALSFAKRWANIIERAFADGKYNNEAYKDAYHREFYRDAKGKKEIGFETFYVISLLQGLLTKETEDCMLDYMLNYDKGIYYIYQKPINRLPETFESIETSRYLSAIEILSGYHLAKEKLGFVVKWLEENKDENGQWDLGSKAKDNVCFPLSDSWRSIEYRKADCTERIASLIQKL